MKKHTTIAVIGSGMGSLAAASLLARDGHQPIVFEQNYLPGGCTSSYYRKGFIFEAGATTLVGLGNSMPLQYILDQTGIQIDATKLETPMRVHLKDGQILTRYQDLDAWIAEAERVFGKDNQRPFWEYCYQISQFVWQNSLVQKTFPPSKLKDLGGMIRNFRFNQLAKIRFAFMSTKKLLQKFNLYENTAFVDFVNEQLLITAQNHAPEVNALFGATALCYTNEPNYYVYGGLIQLVRPFCEYIEEKGGKVITRKGIKQIKRLDKGYELTTSDDEVWTADYVLSGLPINNTLQIFDDFKLQKRYEPKLMKSPQLNSAFQMGIGIKRHYDIDCLHHQIHLKEPLPMIDGASIFISFSHPDDVTRCPLNQRVISVSTHVPNPAENQTFDKEKLCEIVLNELEKRQFLRREDVLYYHASTPSSWDSWLKRKDGFVGGYPQFMKVKPWQMLDARLDKKQAYICGDTTYPGQGIPGVSLSGINAYHKMKMDGLRPKNE